MKFRYDIGFLRAIAVLIVVFFHYQIPFFKGGFVGVDIFFVISGFLMTRIILKGFENESFSIKDFYLRRFTRIVPALIVMMSGVLVLTYFLYFPVDFKDVSIYTFFSGLFLSNYYYLFNSGYFDASSQFNILLHTWSLSVEWQFYMIYPLFLLLVKKIYIQKVKNFKLIFIGITLVSFFLVIVFNNFLPASYSKISFFSFTHRAWEMMFGGIAFLYKDFFDLKVSGKQKKYLSFISLFAIGLSIVLFTDDNGWPSGLTLIPVLASFLLIALNKEFTFYKNPIIQYIGNISYSWYLWHWPICVVFRYFDYSGTGVILLMIISSFILAAISYEFIEKRTKTISLKYITIITSVVLLISFLGYFFKINEYLFPKEAVYITEFKDNYEKTRREQFHSGICHNVNKINYKECLCVNSKKKNILLLGDSHAGQFSLAFRTQLDSTKFNFIEHTGVYSFPLISAKGEKKATQQYAEIFSDFIVHNSKNIDVVLLSCRWRNFTRSGGYRSEKDLVDGMIGTIEALEKLGIRVYIIGQTEEYNIDFPRVKAFELIGRSSKKYTTQESLELNNFLKMHIPSQNYLDVFLNKEIKHYDEINKIPYMFDDNHMTTYGADQVVKLLLKRNIL